MSYCTATSHDKLNLLSQLLLKIQQFPHINVAYIAGIHVNIHMPKHIHPYIHV